MLIKVELEKMIKRKDVWVLATMNIIPLMYAVGIANNSPNITYEGVGKASGYSFLGDMVVFIYMLFIYSLIVAMGQVRSFRGEIENGSIKLYLQRIIKRSDLYWAKVISYSIITIASFIALGVVCVISYYLFLIGRSDIALKAFLIEGQFISISLAIVAVIIYFLFSGVVAMFFSLFFKSYASIAFFTLVWVGFLYLKEFELIRFAIPAYYLDRIIADMGKGSDYFASFVFVVMTVSVMSLILFIGKKRFERIDIK